MYCNTSTIKNKIFNREGEFIKKGTKGAPEIQPVTRGWGGGGVSELLNVKKKSQINIFLVICSNQSKSLSVLTDNKDSLKHIRCALAGVKHHGHVLLQPFAKMLALPNLERKQINVNPSLGL